MTKTKFTVGQEVEFTGYTQLDEGQEEILTVGQKYAISEIKPDGGIVVVGKDGRGDTVFDDEIAAVKAKKSSKSTKSTAKAKATKAAPKAAKPKAKSNTAPKAAAKPKVKAIAPVAPIPAVAAFSDTETVANILESKDMLSAAKELAVAAEETFISLGGVLSHIYETGAHKTLGFDGKRGFADYMLKELNIQYRKGMYLIDIYKVARQYNLDERLLAEIGWSKMKEIANKIDEANATELLEYARDHTREELVAHVRTSYVKAGDGTDNVGRVLKTRLSFSLFGDQVETVNRALDAAKAQMNTDSPELALVLIAAEWSQATEGVDLPVDAAVQALVDRYGIDSLTKAVDKAIFDSGQTAKKNVAAVELVSA